MSPEMLLARLARTGCLGNTASSQSLAHCPAFWQVCAQVGSSFLARAALSSTRREVAVPLCAALACRGDDLLAKVFARVISGGKELREFVRILRSNVSGRKCLGSRARKLVARWFDARSIDDLIAEARFLGEPLRQAHPRPLDKRKKGVYRWILGRSVPPYQLPLCLVEAAGYTEDRETLPNCPPDLLLKLPLLPEHLHQLVAQVNQVWLVEHLRELLGKAYPHVTLMELLGQRLSEGVLPASSAPELSAAGRFTLRHEAFSGILTKLWAECLDRACPLFGPVSVVLGSFKKPAYEQRLTGKVGLQDEVAMTVAMAILKANPDHLIIACRPRGPRKYDFLVSIGDFTASDWRGYACRSLWAEELCSWPLILSAMDLACSQHDDRTRILIGHSNRWNQAKESSRHRLVYWDTRPKQAMPLVTAGKVFYVEGLPWHAFAALGAFARGTDRKNWLKELEQDELG